MTQTTLPSNQNDPSLPRYDFKIIRRFSGDAAIKVFAVFLVLVVEMEEKPMRLEAN